MLRTDDQAHSRHIVLFVSSYLKFRFNDILRCVFSLFLLLTPNVQKAIDTLSQKELRQLLSYRSTDKSSLSNLRARGYDLLKTNYLTTKARLQSILEKQKYVFFAYHFEFFVLRKIFWDEIQIHL